MKIFHAFLGLLFITAMFVGCKTSSDSATLSPRLSTTQFHQQLQSDSSIFLVDVRVVQSRLRNAIPHAVVASNKALLDTLVVGLPFNAKIFLYCDKGVRSKTMMDYMISKGYTNVHDLEGGFSAWKKEKLPTVEVEVIDK